MFFSHAILTGKKTYTLHFDSSPPTLEKVLTAYGEDDFLIDNPLNRYCINDRSVPNRNADGSVYVTISHAMPENTENWLPIGETEFHLFLRIYKPDWNALSGWQPPTVCVK